MPEMESFRYGRKTIKLVKVVGEVRSIEKRELTHVHSTGGGGRISGGHGYIDAPRVYSSTTTQHDFWLRLDDDTEKHFSFDTAAPLPMREGDSVVLVYIEGAAAPMLFHNRTAGAKRILTSGYRLNEAWRFEKATGLSLLYSIAAFFVSCVIFPVGPGATGEANGRIAVMIAAAVFAYRVIARHMKKKAVQKSLDAYLTRVAEAI